MANKIVNYKKIRTILVYGKKKCIYMKPKGKREYVKSKGEFVLLSVYIKKMQKKMKIKGGVFSCLGFGCKNNSKKISKKNSEINSKESRTVKVDLGFLDITRRSPEDEDKDEDKDAWVKIFSPTHDRPFYYNTKTRKASSTLPVTTFKPSIRRFESKDLTNVDVDTGNELRGKFREIKTF